MKYMDYAAMGAAVSASQRASEAFDEIERLQSQIDAMRASAWDAREEMEFQKWIEEFIYQFGKVTGRVESQPGDPVEDFQEIAAYLKMNEEKQINTGVISGLENKKVFENVLARAEKLCGDLWDHPGVVELRNLWEKTETEEKNRLAIENAEKMKREAADQARPLELYRIFMGASTMILAIFALVVGSGGYGIGRFACVAGVLILCVCIWAAGEYELRKKWTKPILRKKVEIKQYCNQHL